MHSGSHGGGHGVNCNVTVWAENLVECDHEAMAQKGRAEAEGMEGLAPAPPFTMALIRSTSLAICVMGSFACQNEALPVVERGRYVELATARNDVICDGTVDYMDGFVALVSSEIGVMPPERIFVRYEWTEPMIGKDGEHVDGADDADFAQDWGDVTVISASRLIHEHELTHAVHNQAWPSSRSVFQEGLAVLFDSHTGRSQGKWPAGDVLDPLLEADALSSDDYDKAWFLVSQVILDHGMEGLSALWHAVPSDASAEQVRQAYQDLFGRPIDALIEPREVSEGGSTLDRWSCYFVVCDEPQPWEGAVWRAAGPSGCIDDAHALGPMGSNGTGTVERYYAVELEPSTPYRFTTSGGVGAYLRECGLQCLPLGSPAWQLWPDTSTSRSDLFGGRYRVEIVADFDELPVDSPGSFEIERLD